MRKAKIGIIGCGKISDAYFKGCKRFNILEISACADIDIKRAREKAKQYNIAKACMVDELIADKEISIVVNLTIPKVHTEINLGILKFGKHVYTEKPFAVSREESENVLVAAKKAKLLVGSAPDTFLGAGIQSCRKLIDDGAIGIPVAAVAFMVCRGHESWHPNPEFYYERGGGPILDMGPYYLTALVNLLGPMKTVTGLTKKTFPERIITSQPKAGKKILVEVETHIRGQHAFCEWRHRNAHHELRCMATQSPAD